MELYARDNKDLTEADAARILEEFILEMKEVLKERKTLILSGLGRMYAAGGDMTANIDRAGGEGSAVFAGEAIKIFCSR